jgi:hypothetical protein
MCPGGLRVPGPCFVYCFLLAWGSVALFPLVVAFFTDIHNVYHPTLG